MISNNGFSESEVLEAFYSADLEYAFRFGLYTYDLEFIRWVDGIEDAKAMCETDAKINTIFSCTVDAGRAGNIDWLNQMIGPEVWMRMSKLGTDGSPYAKFLTGFFEPKTHPFEIEATRASYKIQAYDLSIRLNDSGLDEPYVIAAGTPYFNAIAGILTAGGFIRQNIQVPALSLPEPRTWPVSEGTTLLTVLDDLLEGINCVRYPEANGSYTVREWLNPDTTGASFTYRVDGRRQIYTEASVTQDSYEGFNEVFMVSTAPEREGQTWTARATNNDMSSSLYSGNRGGRTYRKVFTNVEAASQAILNDKCARQELEYRQRYITAELSTRIAPWHAPREIVGVDYPALLTTPRRFEEKRWELTYSSDSRMSHSFSNKPHTLSAVIGTPGGGGSPGSVRPGKRGGQVVFYANKPARINPAWGGFDVDGNPTVIFADDISSGKVSGPFAFNPDITSLMPGEWVQMQPSGNTWVIAYRLRSISL
jgi:hypothetical protein